jgi:hypothetical protein
MTIRTAPLAALHIDRRTCLEGEIPPRCAHGELLMNVLSASPYIHTEDGDGDFPIVWLHWLPTGLARQKGRGPVPKLLPR